MPTLENQTYRLPYRHGVASSRGRFPDGASFRIEIPSVEGPKVFEAALSAAATHGVVVNRVSQGSGAMLLTTSELRDMAAMGAENGVEVSLFVGPRESFDVGANARTPEGAGRGGQLRGVRQLMYGVEDVVRAVDAGIRSFLIADIGLLVALRDLQRAGDLTDECVWKVSVSLAPSNPAALRVLADLGASTVNVPSDLTYADLADMRAATDLPLDLYLESSDALGGVVRGHEIADLVAIGAPLYAKFGLRNARDVYPCGEQLLDDAVRNVRAKVHRAAVALEWLARSGSEAVQSKPHAAGLGLPRRAA
ncbi:hypothetical protein AB0B89_00455 [Sphaerisporangium sp. NPDC049002]|uniref:hypothetical protein n=1 Tax=Sphaerisporangium sp. NPDC049002 TaxID=3155392 RepID=UPI0033FF2B7D